MESSTNNPFFSRPSGFRVLVYFIVTVLLAAYMIDRPPGYLFKEPKTSQEYASLALFYYRKGAYTKVIEMSKKSLALNPKFGLSYLDLGDGYNGLKKPDEAIKNYLIAIEYLKNDPQHLKYAYNNIANAYSQKGDKQKTFDYMHLAYGIGAYQDPQFKKSLQPEVLSSLETNNPQAYKELIKDEVSASHADIIKKLWSDLEYGQSEEVMEKCIEFLKENPSPADTIEFKKLLGKSYLNLQQMKEASDVFKELQSLKLNDEDQAFTELCIAYIYMIDKKYKESLATLDQVIKNHPKYSNIDEAYSYKSEILILQKKKYEAVNLLNDFLQKNPNHPRIKNIQSALADIYVDLGDTLRAYELKQKTGGMRELIFNSIIGCVVIVFFLFGLLAFIKLFFRRKAIEIAQKNIFMWIDLKMILAFFVIIPTFFSLLISYVYERFYLSKDFWDPILLYDLFLNGFLLLISLYILRKKYQLRSYEIGFVSKGFKINVLLPLAIVGGTVAVSMVLSFLFEKMGVPDMEQSVVYMSKKILSNKSSLNVCALFFLIVVIGPFVEEILFRGIVFRILFKYMNLFWAVLLSSFLWASFHDIIPMLVIIFLQGLILAIVYHKTKSLVPCIVTHMMWNLLVFLALCSV